jgi:hypothetical protein
VSNPNVSHKHLVTGVSGSGKTTRLLQLIATANVDVVWVFDGEGELQQRLNVPPRPFAGLWLASVENRVVVFDPALEFTNNVEALDAFCNVAMSVGQQRGISSLLVVDELQKYCGTGAADISPAFVNVLERGRRAGVQVLVATHSPNLVHNRARNQLTHVSAFRLVDPRATAWLEPLGFTADELRALPLGTFHFRKVGADTFKEIKLFDPLPEG